MKQPEPLTYKIQDKTITISTLNGIVDMDGIECLDGGIVRNNGEDVRFLVRIDNKPDLAKMVADWRADWVAYKSGVIAELAINVPGLDELRKAQDAAYNEEHRYNDQMDRMMDNEDNDGVNPPAHINQSLRKQASILTTQYPRAAVYLMAEGYTESDNLSKYSAGKDAMEIIATGGSIEDAKSVLANWYKN